MLSIKNLTKIYKLKSGSETRALDGVSLDFPEKGMIFLLGKSGSGKSTLLNLIGGLDFPTSGEIILKGRSSKDFSQADFDSYRNTYIGFVFQEYNILNEFNVEQNLALAIELQNKKVNKDDVNSLLEQVDLKDFAKRKPNTLSGGQKQRIAIARALIKSPHIIMADEPTGALDSKTGEQVFETLKKLSADKLVIVVSHDRDFAERFGDRIIELKDGKVISDETKRYKEPKKVSDNVSIINEHAISIKDAKELTKADFDKLYEAIKASEGTVFISSGQNASKSMKIARISESGQSDEFIDTKPVELQQYDPKQTKFIKSRMPLGKSIKMGLSGLKTKPIRLAFTMFLSIASFSMFGIVSSLMLYNSSHTYSEALRKTDYTAEMIKKEASGQYSNYRMDFNGNIADENSYSYSTTQEVKFGVEEIEGLNGNHLNLDFIGVMSMGYESKFPFSSIPMTKNSEYYRNVYRLRAVSDVSKSEFQKLGYSLTGEYPVNDNEVLLSKNFGHMLIDSGAVSYTNINQIIGKEFNFSTQKGSSSLKISGFFDCGELPSTYDKLTDETVTISDDEKRTLMNSAADCWNQSFNSVAFVTTNLMNNLIYKNSTYIPSFSRKGAQFDLNKDVWGWSVDDNTWTSLRTEVLVEKFPNSFKFYDMGGNPVSTFSLQDNETYITTYQIEYYKQSQTQNILNMVLWDMSENTLIRVMPTFKTYMSSEENRNAFQSIKDNMWQDSDRAMSFFNQYKDEYKVAIKVKELANNFSNEWLNPNFNTTKYTDSQRELFIHFFQEDYDFSMDEFNQLKAILEENFDVDMPNWFYRTYLERVSSNEDARADSTISLYLDQCNDRGYWANWSSSQIEKIQTWLEAHYEEYMGSWGFKERKLRGYTYATYEVINDSDTEITVPEYLYYKTSSDNKGQLKIKGYIEDSDSTTPLVTKAFALANTYPGDDEYAWINTFTTDYVTPSDAKYSAVFVKTEYTFEQINYMNKKFSSYQYTLTSPKYAEVNMIVSLIDLLKTIFLWTGVGSGVFAALMLLNFISVSISSKKKDIGILRAIGARKIDVFKIFFSESLFVAAICAIVSIGLAIMAEILINNYIYTEIGLSLLTFGIVNIALVIGVALVISFIATIFPVIHSSRKPPVEAIRAL